jgi:hypothetical protein
MAKNSGSAEMSPAKDRFIVTITLSQGAYEDFEAVATGKGLSMATLLRNILETEHESPGFGALLRRYKKPPANE